MGVCSKIVGKVKCSESAPTPVRVIFHDPHQVSSKGAATFQLPLGSSPNPKALEMEPMKCWEL